MPAARSIPTSYPSFHVTPPKLVGGALCLDLVNTVEWRGVPERVERLVDYGEFLVWAEAARVIDRKTRARLEATAKARPEAAAAVLAEVAELRETFAALLSARTPHPGSLARINAWLARAPERTRIATSPHGYAWATARRADDDLEALRLALWPVVWSIADLLTSGRVAEVRHCADRLCDWVFLDDSRGQRRRWCTMEGCGNRAKARRHYRRHRAA